MLLLKVEKKAGRKEGNGKPSLRNQTFPKLCYVATLPLPAEQEMIKRLTGEDHPAERH